MDHSKLQLCKYYDSGKIIKKGTGKTKKGNVQIFKCEDCKKRFTANFGFEKKQFDENTITRALQMYYSGMSVRDISNHYEMMGIEVNHMTIYNGITEYSKLTVLYGNNVR